jgi:hypothetical protein
MPLVSHSAKRIFSFTRRPNGGEGGADEYGWRPEPNKTQKAGAVCIKVVGRLTMVQVVIATIKEELPLEQLTATLHEGYLFGASRHAD